MVNPINNREGAHPNECAGKVRICDGVSKEIDLPDENVEFVHFFDQFYPYDLFGAGRQLDSILSCSRAL